MLYENVCGAYHCIAPNCRVEYGYCHCGCGDETNVVIKGSKTRGTYAEIPRRFIKKHNGRGKSALQEAKREAGEAYVRADGYRALPLDPDSLFAGMVAEGSPWILEHKVVVALQLGRPLNVGETIWHISGDRSTNDPDNLVLLRSEQAFKRLLSEQPIEQADIILRPAWTIGLNRQEIVSRALAGVAA